MEIKPMSNQNEQPPYEYLERISNLLGRAVNVLLPPAAPCSVCGGIMEKTRISAGFTDCWASLYECRTCGNFSGMTVNESEDTEPKIILEDVETEALQFFYDMTTAIPDFQPLRKRIKREIRKRKSRIN